LFKNSPDEFSVGACIGHLNGARLAAQAFLAWRMNGALVAAKPRRRSSLTRRRPELG